MATPGPRTRSYGKFPEEQTRSVIRTYKVGNGVSDPTCGEVYTDDPFLSETYASDYDYTVMTDVVTPNFHKRIRAGELILNPMSWSRVAFKAADGGSAMFSSGSPLGSSNYCYDKNLWITGSLNFTVFKLMNGTVPNCPLLETEVASDEQVIIAAVAGIDPTNYHVMEDVLQLRQFLSSIMHPIQGMKDIAVQFANAKTRVKSLASAWSKYRFELLPLLGTAEALVKTALGPAKRLERGVRLRSASTSQGHDSFNGIYSSENDVTFFSCNHTRTIRKRAVVYYTLKRAHSGISQSLGTRFKDLPTGLWNTVTLTFMLDRLINISQFITALSNLCDPDIHVEGGCLTVWDYTRTEDQVLYDKYSSDPERILSFDTKPAIMVYDNVTRTVVNPMKVAASPLNLDFRPPGLVSDTSRILDLLALTIQRLKF